MTTREAIVNEARTWLGTPFQDQGRLKGKNGGVDCVNFVAEVAKATNAVSDVEFENNYRRSTNGETMVKLFRQYMTPIERKDAQPGDTFVVRYSAGHWHCMIVTEREENLETEFRVIEAGRNGVAEHRIDSSVKRRIHSAYRVKGIQG